MSINALPRALRVNGLKASDSRLFFFHEKRQPGIFFVLTLFYLGGLTLTTYNF